MTYKVKLGSTSVEADTLDEVLNLAFAWEERKNNSAAKEYVVYDPSMDKPGKVEPPKTEPRKINAIDVWKNIPRLDQRAINALCILSKNSQGLHNSKFWKMIGMGHCKGLSGFSKHWKIMLRNNPTDLRVIDLYVVRDHVYYPGPKVLEGIAHFSGLTVDEVMDILTTPEK